MPAPSAFRRTGSASPTTPLSGGGATRPKGPTPTTRPPRAPSVTSTLALDTSWERGREPSRTTSTARATRVRRHEPEDDDPRAAPSRPRARRDQPRHRAGGTRGAASAAAARRLGGAADRGGVLAQRAAGHQEGTARIGRGLQR